MSAQEAGYHCLSLHLYRSSRACVYINTNPPDERVKMLKPRSALQKLPKNSSDIFVGDIFDKYMSRPLSLNNVCLAEYASCYCKIYNEDDAMDDDRDTFDRFAERKKPKIIRYHRYSLLPDPHNYYREQLLLFLPWWDESEINYCDIHKSYFKNQATLNRNRAKFSILSDEALDNAMEAVNAYSSDDDDCFTEPFCHKPNVDIFEQQGISEESAKPGYNSYSNTQLHNEYPLKILRY